MKYGDWDLKKLITGQGHKDQGKDSMTKVKSFDSHLLYLITQKLFFKCLLCESIVLCTRNKAVDKLDMVPVTELAL